MFQAFQENHPIISICLFLAVMAMMVALAIWARRFKYVPSDDHNPSDHHALGMIMVFVGIMAVAAMAMAGWANVDASAITQQGESVTVTQD